MSIGTSLGVVFGLLIFDNIGLGLPLGIAMGVAIGAGLDADAKKKGMVL
ncbi:glycine zipper family protein [Gracilibacillus thailandensis]|uniref:Glycine zipper family protein n=2 Tax=Gracilibacillus thailandensis TaxID=563735 RepID=A0A6N7R255_9BACI|nr:glycine zipper family protein [Gracilibacillus thailandensis]